MFLRIIYELLLCVKCELFCVGTNVSACVLDLGKINVRSSKQNGLRISTYVTNLQRFHIAILYIYRYCGSLQSRLILR